MKYTKNLKTLISSRYLHFVFALGLLIIFAAGVANSPTPARAEEKSPVPIYDGRFEIADCSVIRGWAAVIGQYDPIYVDIYDGPHGLTTRLANGYRPDIFGEDNPFHGFFMSTPGSLKDGNIHTIHAKFNGTFLDLEDSPRSIACGTTMFPTATPQSTASGQGATWEQGVEFSSSMNGVIKKIRFWRAAEEPKGGHIGNIWSASGTKLKTVNFTNETDAPGWQTATVNFPIDAGVKYRVSYNINYVVAKTFNVFQSGPITNGPLTAWKSYYSTPGGSFPTTGSTSNLFADIEFNAPK